jgi:hypothetical protein
MEISHPVCRLKHVELSINFGITNSIIKLHLVGIFIEGYCSSNTTKKYLILYHIFEEGKAHSSRAMCFTDMW